MEAREAAKQIELTSESAQFCFRHPKEATNLSCGRCERPICTKCAIIGPAGPRCPDCAKSKTEFRPAAVVHGAKRGIGSVVGAAGKAGPWGWYWLIALIVMVGGLIRGCMPELGQPTSYHDSSGSAVEER